ncbi:hypothetical protein LQW54_002552 [Pestalotiopsis sp. IQ-011]
MSERWLEAQRYRNVFERTRISMFKIIAGGRSQQPRAALDGINNDDGASLLGCLGEEMRDGGSAPCGLRQPSPVEDTTAEPASAGQDVLDTDSSYEGLLWSIDFGGT